MTRLNREDQTEVNNLLSEALNGSRTPNPASSRRFISAMNKAEMEGRAWPEQLRETILEQWAYVQQKTIAKRESALLISHNGRSVVKATRVGRRKVRADGSRGPLQQELLSEASWAEVDDFLKQITIQMDGLDANRTMVAKLKKLQSRFPDTYGPNAACVEAGTTFGEYLESEAS